VINRRRKIISIQVVIFIIALSLLFVTYRDKNQVTEKAVKIEAETDSDTNNFFDIEYSGFDLNGNRYTLVAGKANFNTNTPEAINMKRVVANFYLKDGTILKVISDEGLYNNITLDMLFKKNVKATYLANTLLSEELDYSSTDGKLLASGNVRGESVEKGKFIADNVEYNLSNNNLDFSMLGDKQVNVKLKD
tara:strand:- start:892 stop:1467 length:576 start_codon:yes stop_codon:yes gene_type:complete